MPELPDVSEVPSPALVVFRELAEQNLDKMLRMAGEAAPLRPHCKTHKMPEVIRLALARGINKHKCATLAEAEMLAEAGAGDVLLAYNVVGPNVQRAVAFAKKYPQVEFSVTADDAGAVGRLDDAARAAGVEIGVMLDLDVGMHRTGIEMGEHARELYRTISNCSGLTAAGFHVYDGHLHMPEVEERSAAVAEIWSRVAEFRDQLEAAGLAVRRIVAGGTPTFPMWAAIADDAIECSPGTCVLHDAGYGTNFPDLDFEPAALLLTRVVSRPGEDLVTCDLGYKAVAADPPAARRVVFPDLPDAELVTHSEEHLTLRTSSAADLRPGDELWAVPWHICPSVALHREAVVISGGRIEGRWPVVGRDRLLSL